MQVVVLLQVLHFLMHCKFSTCISYTKLLEIDTPGAAGQVDPYIPDEGIRFRDTYIDISTAITVLYFHNEKMARDKQPPKTKKYFRSTKVGRE